MASALNPTSKEAMIATITRSCLHEFRQCTQQLEGKDKIHIQTRHADLRLWADSVGATAEAKASLDSRFQHRPSDIHFILGLLSMLEGFLKECFIAANNKANSQDIITNIDSTINSLAFIGVQIRRSGRKSRLRKADDSFDQNRDRYRKLRAHLACVVTAKPTEKGRPKDEGKEIHSVDYFANLKLRPIQERLVEANLRRRHRFMEAQRHSHGLKDPSTKVSHTVIPQHYIAMAAIDTKQEVSPMQNKDVAAVMQQNQTRPTGPRKDALTMPTTSASGLDSKWGGLQDKHRPGSTVTRITAITASARYPKARAPSNPDQKLVQCPCCCQAIPANELEDRSWRKHVANDLCPYTCVLENCPTPYNFYVTQKEWNDHIMNDHAPQWQCPCCEGDPPRFQRLSEITSHIMSTHLHVTSNGLENLLSDAEINVMGITECPLCNSEGPEDSPDLVEHVLQHVHDFSLRSLPWPTDPTISLDKPVGIFDMSHATNIVEDDKGNKHTFNISEWAETVTPTFDLGRGVKIVNDPEGNELVLDIAGWPENTTLESGPSLQLCNFDRNPPKVNEEELTVMARSERDYFSQNDYFKEESSDGQFPSQTSNSSQQTQNTIGSHGKHRPKQWICIFCSLPSMQGDDAYFKHLKNRHPEEIESIELNNGDVEIWKRSMLDEAYRNGVEVISESASHSESSEFSNVSDASINAQDRELYVASDTGDVDLVRLLLDRGANVNAKGRQYADALLAASTKGHKQVVRLLLDTGKVDVDSKDKNYGQTPLSWAAENGHEAVVELLLKTGKVDTDSKDKYGQTPLSWAAENGYEAVVELLLKTGKVDADLKDKYGRTPLSWAADEAVVELLLKTGKVDVDSKDKNYGQTPLSWAAENGHEAVVELLLKTGKVDTDSKDKYGQTPLSWAAENGHEAVVELLLKTGKVDADSKDKYGRTPLSWAAENGHEAVVELLLNTGKVDFDSKDIDERTPLSWAAGKGHEAVAELLRSRFGPSH